MQNFLFGEIFQFEEVYKNNKLFDTPSKVSTCTKKLKPQFCLQLYERLKIATNIENAISRYVLFIYYDKNYTHCTFCLFYLSCKEMKNKDFIDPIFMTFLQK